MDPVTLYSGTTGLNTVVDPTRLRMDFESGSVELAEAVNVSVDQTGRLGRRLGATEIIAGAHHSLFCDGGECLVGQGTNLYKVNTDFSLTGIRSGMSGGRIGFCQVNNDIYYGNGTDNGIVQEGVSKPWPVNTQKRESGNKRYSPAPVGIHFAYYNGRMYIADGAVLWYSEPYALGLYDYARSFVPFASKVIMVKAVANGLYVSTLKETIFLGGANPKDFTSDTVAPYPAYEWSDAIDYVEALEVGLEFNGLCATWSSPEGAILGTPDGRIVNLNKSKLIYPENGQQGASLIRGYNFIHNIF